MIKKNNLKKCKYCGEPPSIIKGEHGLSKEVRFAIACENPRCSERPATDRIGTLRGAKKAWDRGLVTKALF